MITEQLRDAYRRRRLQTPVRGYGPETGQLGSAATALAMARYDVANGARDDGSRIEQQSHAEAPAKWCAGWNRPGYLPDAEPMDCPTWESARDFLIWELERWDCPTSEDDAQADFVIAELRNATPDQEITTRDVLGVVCWIVAAETPFDEAAL